jgi:hypothetical protein
MSGVMDIGSGLARDKSIIVRNGYRRTMDGACRKAAGGVGAMSAMCGMSGMSGTTPATTTMTVGTDMMGVDMGTAAPIARQARPKKGTVDRRARGRE